MELFSIIYKSIYAILEFCYKGIAMNRLKELRKSKKLSQTDVANAIGCSQTAVYHYEAGDRQIPVESIPQLCKLFACSSDYLLGLSDKNSRLPDAEDASLPELTRELLTAIPDLSSEEQEHIRDFIRLVRRD